MQDPHPPKRFPFDALSLRDKLLLWAVRVWAASASERPMMPVRVITAFEVAGIPEATAPLHELLTVISQSNQAAIAFRPVCCPHVSPEEARFLTAVTVARHDACESYTASLLTMGLDYEDETTVLTAARSVSIAVFEALQPNLNVTVTADTATRGQGAGFPDRSVTLLH